MKDPDLINRVKQLMDEDADNANSFAKKVGIDPGNLRKKIKGEQSITKNDTCKISEALGINREWLERGIGNIRKEVINTKEDDNTYEALERYNKEQLVDVIISLKKENTLLKENIADLRKHIEFLQVLRK